MTAAVPWIASEPAIQQSNPTMLRCQTVGEVATRAPPVVGGACGLAMVDHSAENTSSQITLDLEEAPVHVDTRRLQSHNESDNSLMINLTDEAKKSLEWEAGEQIIVKLYKDEDAIKLERYKSDRC